MQVTKDNGTIEIRTDAYCLKHNRARPMYVDLMFDCGIGAELFVPSGVDRDERIDEIITLGAPKIKKNADHTEVRFIGRTTLWQKAEYTFQCFEDRVLYSYEVFGNGSLDNARFFEGFLKDDPRMQDRFYPLFCGWGRHVAWHRPFKDFMQSSKPKFDLVYSSAINSGDIRYCMYYETTTIRVNSGRVYQGGDWLVTPPPFLYILGDRVKNRWVTMGLVVEPGAYNFTDYVYSGGEGFGLSMDYDGYTRIEGRWQSPAILFEQARDVYEGTEKYCRSLRDHGLVKSENRERIPRWWKEPIFGGWGEQMFHSQHWEDYYQGQAIGYSSFGAEMCTRRAYEDMLAELARRGVNPTILIVDNRWYRQDSQLDVDEKLWPDMKSFIAEQHEKGRKVILWVSPFAYCCSKAGKDVPPDEHMRVDVDNRYVLEIDTDVFYPACEREKRKVRVKPRFEPQELKEHVLWDMVIDVLNPKYEQRVRGKIHNLLSPDGLDADGFEFDYTHFVPIGRHVRPVTPRDETIWGVEFLHRLMWIYYDQAKKSKPDALVISHTFNPYFDDVVDMLRLQDIYTDKRSISEQMHHRARIANIVCPGCVIHTDQHPMPSLEAWREYAKFQPEIGNPCLYYVTGIETTKEKFTEEDWTMIRAIWSRYRARLDAQYGPAVAPEAASKRTSPAKSITAIAKKRQTHDASPANGLGCIDSGGPNKVC